ncbi:MAG: hypothetical protein AAF693_12780 [Bacteroidota bacterium]
MRSILFTALALVTAQSIAQQPFEKYGKEVPIATMSNGKFEEFFDQDTLIQIGTAILNRLSGELYGFVKYDTLHSEATLDPQVISRWLSPDPLADDFTSLSPYNFVENNPINMIDPDGRSAIGVIDKENHTVTIQAHYYFYGGSADKNLAQNLAGSIAEAWNAAGGKVKVGGVEYSVNFEITAEAVTVDDATALAENNTDLKNNFVRVEENNVLNTSVSRFEGNDGFWITSKGLGDGSQTAAHEFGHGVIAKYDHTLTVSGHTKEERRGSPPDIMSARDGIIDPASRKVKQFNINQLFRNAKQSGNQLHFGTLSNTIHNRTGQGTIKK